MNFTTPPVTDPTPLFELFRGNHATELLVAAVTHLNVFARLAGGAKSFETLRTELGLTVGDTVDVVLEKDESKYGMPMPEELQEVLNQDPEGDKLFHTLTAGKHRSMMYYIAKVKDIDKRIHTALVFIEHLKKNDGKVVYEGLQQELKRQVF